MVIVMLASNEGSMAQVPRAGILYNLLGDDLHLESSCSQCVHFDVNANTKQYAD